MSTVPYTVSTPKSASVDSELRVTKYEPTFQIEDSAGGNSK